MGGESVTKQSNTHKAYIQWQVYIHAYLARMEAKEIDVEDFTVQRAAFEGLWTAHPVLFIHGMWEGAWVWKNYQAFFSTQGYTSHTLDLRGRPGSLSVDNIGKVSISNYIQDAYAAAEKLGNPILVGHSMGGLLALKLAELLDPPATIAITPAPPRGVFALRTWPLLKSTIRHLPEILFRRPIMPTRREADALELNCLPLAEQDRVFNMMVPESGRVAFEIAVKGVPVDPSKVQCPLLVVGAEADRITPAKMVRQIARKYRAEYFEYPGRGHMITLEPSWEQVVRDIIGWLNKYVLRPLA